MNRLFDFSPAQVKFLAVMTASALVMGVYLLVRAYAHTPADAPRFEVIVGEHDKQFTGLFIIDPNTSPVDSLELLPGIGRVLADRIVEYRKTHTFESEVDIMYVKGIGPKLFERLQPYLKVTKP